MFALIRRISAARTAAVLAGVKFHESCTNAVSTAASRAEAALARAHDRASFNSGYLR